MPGQLTFVLQFAHNLKNADWFKKQDPYAIIKVGNTTAQSKTINFGGRNPVWIETFHFSITNEDIVEVALYDEDTFKKHDFLGTATIPLATVCQNGSDQVIAAVTRKSGKPGGTLSVALRFTPAPAAAAEPPAYAPQPTMLHAPALPDQPGYENNPQQPWQQQQQQWQQQQQQPQWQQQQS